MIKKIVTSECGKQISKKAKSLKNVQIKKSHQPVKDTFEHSVKQDTLKQNKKTYPSDCDNLEFQIQKIEFYPEDIKKMEKMSLDERIEYKRKLKEQERYKVIEDDKKD